MTTAQTEPELTRPRVPYRLKTCVWEITLACCFSCAYCGSRAGHARDNELTTAECIDVARQLAELGCKRVSLIGGEVFMRRDWTEIVDALISQGIRVCIITNGFMMSDELIAKLRALKVESVAVSLDGVAEIHDAFRQEGSHDRALTCINRLASAGIPVSVISTLNATNSQVDHLEAFAQELFSLPLFAWQIQACSPMGFAADSEAGDDAIGNDASSNVIDPDRHDDLTRHASLEVATLDATRGCGGKNAPALDHRIDAGAVIDFVERTMYDAPFAMGVADNIGYFTPNDNRIRGNRNGGRPFRGCAAGLSTLGIDSVGNVRGCESMYDPAFIEGNLRETTLRTIWENPDAFAYNRHFTPSKLSGPCATCEFGSRCAGGCRSYNFFTHGKLHESSLCARTHT